MTPFLTMCRIEILKLRRTLALWMIFVAPSIVVLLQLMIWAQNKNSLDVDVDLWLSFQRNILTMWAIFMQPLFAALIVALVYHLDHASQGWLRLFVLPVPRWTIPAAKLVVVLAMMTAATVTLHVLTMGATWLFAVINHRIVLPVEVPFVELAVRTGRVFLTSLIVVVIQNAISLRFASVPVSLGAGIAGTFLALFATSWKHGPYFPWLMGLYSIHGKEDVMARLLWLSPTLTILVAAGTLIYATRRDPGTY